METAELITRPAPAALIPPQRQPAAAPTVGAVSPVCGEGRFDGQLWTYRNGFEGVLAQLPLAAWVAPEAQAWQRIKENARREVWRAKIGGQIYYLKYYALDGWTMRLRHLFKPPACAAEWRGGMYALEAGIPAVRPAGCTHDLRRGARRYALLVTEAVEPTYPLSDFWQQLQRDDDPVRRRRDTARMTELLADMIAMAHQAGLEHCDMHAENILVQPVAPGRYRTLFVDLQSIRQGMPIGRRAIVRNLAQLNQWFRRHSTIAQRWRFLRSYLRWRDEYETAFPHGRRLDLDFRTLVRSLSRAAERHANRLWARRDRRVGRNGRYFARLRLGGGWRATVALQAKHALEDSRSSEMVLPSAWWRQQLAKPLPWFGDEASASYKNSHSAAVRRAALTTADAPLPVVLKRPLARNWRRKLRQLLPPSRSLRGWQRGYALINRDLPTPRPLAVIERRIGPFVRDSLLITEALPGAVDLDTHLRAVGRGSRQEHHADKCALARALGRLLRRLEERGFEHHDCKASNLLVLERPTLRLCWIDMDGLCLRRRRPDARRRARTLMRLHVSLLDIPSLTRTDRVRFLREYCARWGARRDAWKAVWREVAPQVAPKLEEQAARRAWKRERYGRE